MTAFRLWLSQVLIGWAAWVHPDPLAVGMLATPAPPRVLTALEQAARTVTTRLRDEPFSSVSKRQIAFRDLRDQFPGVGASDLNFAVEEAVRGLPPRPPAAAPVTQTEEHQP